MAARRKRWFGGGGCSFLLVTGLFACMMLMVNGILISVAYPSLVPLGPAIMNDPRFAQTVMFLGPVLLLLAEWWLIDRLVEWFSDRRRTDPQDRSRSK